MQYLEPKAPTSVKFYELKYDKQFAGDTIVSVAAAVASGTVLITKQAFLNTSVGLMISGGAVDEESLINLIIQTNSGQVLYDSASIYIIADETAADFSVITKQQIVEYAFQDLRLSGYTFDHSSDEISAMLSRLDALMREYRLRGIDTGYNHPKSIGMSNLNDIAGIEDGLTLSIATLVACSYMDGIGKTYSPNLIKKQQTAFNFIYAYCRSIPERVLPHFTPRGRGSKYSTLFPFMFQISSSTKTNMMNGLQGQFVTASLWDSAIWNINDWN